MKNEVTVKEENKVSTQVLTDDWGVPTTPSQDMVVPKILPMQGMSKLVMDRKAMIGEFRDSLSGNLLGSIDKPIEVIPFYLQKVWDVKLQEEDGSYKYAKTIPLVEDPMAEGYNDNLPWEGEEDGRKVQRIRRMNFFVLLPHEISGGGAMPYVLSFKSTSLKEGKKLYTQMYIRNFKAGLPPAQFLATIGGNMVTNTKGTFVVPQVTFGRKATPEELKECLSWIKLVKKGAVKVDTSDDTDTVETGDLSEQTEF